MKATPAGSHVKRPTTFPRGLRVWRLSDGSGVRNNVTITRPRRHGQHRLLQQQCLKVCLEAVIPALTAAVGLRLSKNQKEMLGDKLLANPSAAGFWAAALRAKSLEMGWVRSGTRRARVLPLRSKLQHEILPLETAAPQPPPAQPQLQSRAPEGPQAVGMGWPSTPKAFPQKKKRLRSSPAARGSSNRAVSPLPAPLGAEEVAGSTRTPRPACGTGAPERLCSERRPKAQLSTKAFRGIT